MSFKGRFQPRKPAGDRLERLDYRGDSRLFRSEHAVHGNCELVADARRDRGSAALVSSFMVGERLKADLCQIAEFDGDFAFALIDKNEPVLVLGLAPLSELELHFRLHPDGGVSFATDLRELIDDRERPDIGLLAKALHFGAFFEDEAGFYPGVRRVLPGTTVTFGDGGCRTERFWDLPPPNVRLNKREAAHQLRAALERSVQSRLAAFAGLKASLLSAGRDSSAVTAIAARFLANTGERLDAWTAAAFPGVESDPGRLLDEAPVASITASRFSNVDHHIVRPAQIDLCARLDEIHAAVALPIVQPLAVAWCESVWDGCEAAGDRLLLSGDFGNYGLSAGGLVYLEDVRLEAGIVPWLRSAASIALASPAKLRPLAGAMLGRRWQDRRQNGPRPLEAFIRGDLREAWGAHDDRQESKSYRQWLRDGVRVSTTSNDLVRIGRRLETTDPTRDRRLVELVHSLPSKMLAGPADRRQIFDMAFGDLLPREVVRPHARGRQNVDWHYSYQPDLLKQGLGRYRKSALVREMIDCDALAAALEYWPATRTLHGPIFDRMVWGVLPALSMASYIYSRG